MTALGTRDERVPAAASRDLATRRARQEIAHARSAHDALGTRDERVPAQRHATWLRGERAKK